MSKHFVNCRHLARFVEHMNCRSAIFISKGHVAMWVFPLFCPAFSTFVCSHTKTVLSRPHNTLQADKRLTQHMRSSTRGHMLATYGTNVLRCMLPMPTRRTISIENIGHRSSVKQMKFCGKE